MQALAELGVLFPVNGAFFTYACRFVDPSWGFAIGWDYAIGWLAILPFEITAASLTIAFWPSAADINIGVWIAVFLVVLTAVQFFGVRGYGEVEFVLSMVKILACTGFIILGIIINCGGVPTDNRGYIGGKYWQDPGAFRHGFKGFCSVFVTASFAFGGTELSGLAAAEAKNPLKSIPQVCDMSWQICLGKYVLAKLGAIGSRTEPVRLGNSTSLLAYRVSTSEQSRKDDQSTNSKQVLLCRQPLRPGPDRPLRLRRPPQLPRREHQSLALRLRHGPRRDQRSSFRLQRGHLSVGSVSRKQRHLWQHTNPASSGGTGHGTQIPRIHR